MGESAESHLVQLLTYSTIQKRDLKLNYMIDLFGPSDLNDLFKTDAGWLLKSLFKVFKPQLYNLRHQLLASMTSYYLEEDNIKV